MTFTPRIDPAALADLRQRLERIRWPEAETVDDWRQGVPLNWLHDLIAHWREGYDWDRFSGRLTRHPQVKTTIQELGIHALHVRSPHDDAVPIVLTHGWPSTAFEFDTVIGLLTEPERGQAFHVVCPSLPGYGFSDRPAAPGWGRGRIADAWAELMTRLGYERFLAHGGDWGAFVTTELAIRHPDRLAGIHLTLPLAKGTPEDAGDLSPFERDGLAREAEYRRHGFGYAAIQSTRPQTIGYGLVDSPVALCAWIAEKLYAWSDRDETGAPRIDRDAMLDIVSLYWLTATGASAARLYAEALRSDITTPVTTPTACSLFPAEIIRPPREAVRRRYTNLVFWHEMTHGGHFPALETPGDLAAEIHHFAEAVGP